MTSRSFTLTARLHLIPARLRQRLTQPGFIMLWLPLLWLMAFVLFPLLIVVKLSLSQATLAIPPYLPLWQWQESTGWGVNAGWQQFVFLLSDSLYWQAYWNSLRIATVATALCLLLAYPMAYAIWCLPSHLQRVGLSLIVLPFWTSFLIRVYAWVGILKAHGWLQQGLNSLGFNVERVSLLHTEAAVYIGLVYAYLPFMILPIYATLERIDRTLIQAAQDLGCTPWQSFWRVTRPLSLPGVIAGCLLVLVPAVGEFVIPDLLGGNGVRMIGKVLWLEFFNNRDWPLAAAIALVLLVLLVVPVGLLQYYNRPWREHKATLIGNASAQTAAARRGV